MFNYLAERPVLRPMTTRMLSRVFCLFLFVALLSPAARPLAAQEDPQTATVQHIVRPGDTWTALAIRYNVAKSDLQAANPHPNPLRNPVIGDAIAVPANDSEGRTGTLLRKRSGGLLQLALLNNRSPWELALSNGLPHPARPLFGQAIFVAGTEAQPLDLPIGFQSLELSAVPAQPGWPLAFRATTEEGPAAVITATVGTAQFESFSQPGRIVGVGATGAFFTPGAPELTVKTANGLWSQPWRFVPGIWDHDQITLTGAAAAIDQAAIAAERERMFAIWSQVTPEPLWQGPFRTPIDDYLGISSTYGARRSYNGGPYSSYHEGVDFSAYRGTPVFAAGDGVVVLAEPLYVRGGAVVIDHGLSIFSGYYHMSAVHAAPGQQVSAGDLIGEVGTEGLSSGNHLHWDFLVAEVWVDARVWNQQNLSCWILEGRGRDCG